MAEKVPSRRPQIEELEDRNLLAAPAVGTWTSLTNMAPDFPGTMTLLSSGQVMIQGYVPGNDFMLLTPDTSGSYVNGTFSFAASMSTTRLYYSSNLLANGNLFVMGGEYSDPNYDINSSNTGEIYNPQKNTWTPTTPFPQAAYGDEPSMLLPDGHSILLGTGDMYLDNTYVYNTQTGTYSGPFPTADLDSTDEEAYVKLPNNNILRYDIFTSAYFGAPGNAGYAEQFNPSTDTWIDDSPANGTANGSIPLLTDNVIFEMGPGIRLQDGRVFFIGSGSDNGATAFYNPATNTWSAGPNIPYGMDANGNMVPFGSDDGPAAELPNGDVIFAADPGAYLSETNNNPNYLSSAPQELFVFDPKANTITQLPNPPAPAPADFQQVGAYADRMLVLPTGQVLFGDTDMQIWIFTPAQPKPVPQYRPVISSLAYNGTAGSFTLTGTQLNGQSAGSAYGDDVESDENYPVVRFQGTGDNVYYGTTTNWSNTGVATGSTPEAVTVQLPVGMPAGSYRVYVSGAGLQSDPFVVKITPSEVATLGPVPFGTSLAGGSGGLGNGAVSFRDEVAGASLALSHTGASGAASFVHQALTPQDSSGDEATSKIAYTVPQGADTSIANYFGLTNREKILDFLFSTGVDDLL
jgi:hypothetical protein